MLINYTAQRSVIDSHIAGEDYALSINITTFDDAEKLNKASTDMLSGNVYTLVHSENKRFSFNTQIIKGATLSQMVEFIDSVKYGELFELVHPDTGQTHLVIYQSHNRQRVANRLNEFRYSIEVLTQQ